MTTRTHNGHPDIHALIGAGSEIESKYRQVAEILFAAILREPEIFAIEAGKMHPVWWKETQYERAAKAVWNQHTGASRHYSVDSVCLEAGIPLNVLQGSTGLNAGGLYDLMSRNIDTPLQLALEMFIPVYRQWVEHRAAQFTAHGLAQGWEAEQIRARHDQFRDDSKAYMTTGVDNSIFDEWFENKMQGLETMHPCRPALQTIIKKRLQTGYEPKVFHIIGGRTGMGKTTYLLGEILQFCRDGARGVFVTRDMPTHMIKIRLVGMISGFTLDDDWTILTDGQRQRIIDAKRYVDSMPVIWMDRTNDVNEIISECYNENYKEPVKWLAIDFLQKLKDGNGSHGSRTLEIGAINTKLKLLASIMSIPVIALSQISRAVEIRGGSKRPQLSDFKDSGSIEEDADIIKVIYIPEQNGILEDENGESLKGKAEIIYLKQRLRPKDAALVGFDGVRGFYDLETEDTHEQGRTIERDLVDYSEPQSGKSALESARPNLDLDTVPF